MHWFPKLEGQMKQKHFNCLYMEDFDDCNYTRRFSTKAIFKLMTKLSSYYEDYSEEKYSNQIILLGRVTQKRVHPAFVKQTNVFYSGPE